MRTLDSRSDGRKNTNDTNPTEYHFRTEQANLLEQSTSFYDAVTHGENYENIIQRSAKDLRGSFMIPARNALIYQPGHFITQTTDNEGNINPYEYKVLLVHSYEDFSCERICSFMISEDKMNYRITGTSNRKNPQEFEPIIRALLENKLNSILMLEYQPHDEPKLDSTLSVCTP